jgi:hypothetical protein
MDTRWIQNGYAAGAEDGTGAPWIQDGYKMDTRWIHAATLTRSTLRKQRARYRSTDRLRRMRAPIGAKGAPVVQTGGCLGNRRIGKRARYRPLRRSVADQNGRARDSE